jgi:hypothetical protein
MKYSVERSNVQKLNEKARMESEEMWTKVW